MATIQLGEPVFGQGLAVTYEAGEAVSAGDVVAISGGALVTADGTTDTNPIGIVGDDAEAGDNVKVWVAGIIAANVAGGVTAGTELGTSATEGQLGAGSGGFEALSDEGGMAGLSHGSTMPANAAAVKLP